MCYMYLRKYEIIQVVNIRLIFRDEFALNCVKDTCMLE